MAGLHFDATYNNADVIRKVRECQKAFAELGNTAEIQGRRIDAAFEKISLKSLERMLEIMKNFPKEIQGISSFQKQIDGLEKHIERVNQRIASVGSGKLGSTFSDASSNINIGNVLKEQVYVGSQAVNDLTEKIIQQKSLIKDIEGDVRALGEAYRRAGEGTTKGNALFADFRSAKAAVQEEKNALFELQTQQAQARLSVRKLKDEQSLYQKEGQNVVESNESMSVSFKKALGVIGGVAALKQLGSEIIKVRGEFQAMQTAIETLVGKDMAGNLIPQIKELAKVSPLTLTDMIGAEKMMLGFNIKAEDTIRYLQALGDISMGNSQKFNSLTLAFSQMSATGKLMGQDLNQMINAGFNPLQQISDTTGKSIATLKEEMSKGVISAEMVQKAFVDATSAGGKFFGMSENASKTINGQLSMMQDALDEVFNEIGTKGEGAIMTSIQSVTGLIENYETIGKILTGLIGTYGIYRTAVALVTMAHSLQAVRVGALTTMEAIHYGWLVVLKKAQLALNAAMLTNPYVAVAVAVGTLLTAMWALHDSTTAAEKAQDSYNKKVEDAAKKAQDYKQNLESLISELQNEVTAETRKMEILDEIKKGYPSLFQKFIDEKGHIKDLTEAWKAYNEEASKNKAIQNKNNVNGLKESISEQKRFLELFDMGINDRQKSISSSPSDKTIWNKYNGKGTLNIKKDIEAGERELWKWEKEVRDDEFTQWKVDLKGKTDEQIKAIREAMISRSKSAKGDKNLLSALGKRIIALDDESNSRKPLNETQNKSYWEKQKKDAETALDTIDSKQRKLLNSGKFDGIDTNVVANYKAQSKLLKEAQNELKIYDTTGKYDRQQESAADKLRKEQEKYNLLLDKQKREEERMKTDSKNELDQIEIDGLAEGSEKVLEQRKLNHDKELEAIKREAEDKKIKAVEAARSAHESNPENKENPFDADKFAKSEPAKIQFASFDKVAEEKTKTTETKYNRGDDLAGLLSEYQDYTDKRLAIETKYNNDLATLEDQRKIAIENGDTKQVEQIDRAKAQATANKGKELMGLDYDKLKESPEYVRAFENLKETSSETLNSLLSQLENAKGAAAKVLSPDQLREYTTTIQEIMDELDARNPWQALSDKKQELADAEQGLAQAQIELENARQTAETVKGGGKVEYTTTKFNQKTGKIDSTKAYLTEVQALDKVKDKTETYNDAKDKVVKKSAQVKKAEKETRDIIDELSKTISDVGDAIGGSAGEIIGLIGNIGSFTMMAMSGVEAAADTSATAISTVEKASVILAIIGAAVQIATKIFDLFGKDTTTEKYEDAKEAYESYINILDEVIDKQLELAESLSGDNANAAYNKAIELIKTQSEAAKVLGKQYLNSGASGKSHSKGYSEVEDMSWDGWNQAAQSLGMSIDQFKEVMGGRMSGLFDLTSEQMAKLQSEAPIFWAQLDSDTQDYAKQVADGVSKVAEVVEQRMADTTLIDVDTLRNDFHDLLADMDANTADFADNFEEYMKNAILNSMLKENYMGRLEEWRKKFSAAMEGGMTKEEHDALKAEGQQLSDEMKAEQEAMKEMYGWTSEESSSQDSAQKGFAAMSQDTGEELNGRFTALQISNEEIKNSMLSMLSSMNIISVSTSNNGITLMEIRNIALMSNSHLEDIAKYTKELIGFRQTISNIEHSAKAMAGK